MSKSRFDRYDEEEEEEGANWIDSYSDLVTDLMAIFVVLFSFAMMNQAIVAYNESHEGVQDVGTSGAISAESAQLEETLADYIEKEKLSDFMSVTLQGDNTIMLRMSEAILFDSANATITPEAKTILDSVAGMLDEFGVDIKMIRVEGHADNRPINTPQFPSNWELSSTRAVNVVRYILDVSSLMPSQFSAVGYAEFAPIADNETEEGKAKNRRVDFIIELRPGDADDSSTA